MIIDLHSMLPSWLYMCNPISMHLKICRTTCSCVPNGYIEPHPVKFEESSPRSNRSVNFLLADLIFPYFLGVKFGEYLVCQYFVGPHIPLFMRCHVFIGPPMSVI